MGPSRSTVHCIGVDYIHAFVHKQVDRFDCFLCSSFGKLDFAIRIIGKTASLTLDHSKKRKPALFQEFPLTSTILLDRSHASFSIKEVIVKEAHQKLLLQKHYCIAVGNYTGISIFGVGLMETQHILIWFIEHRTGIM